MGKLSRRKFVYYGLTGGGWIDFRGRQVWIEPATASSPAPHLGGYTTGPRSRFGQR